MYAAINMLYVSVGHAADTLNPRNSKDGLTPFLIFFRSSVFCTFDKSPTDKRPVMVHTRMIQAQAVSQHFHVHDDLYVDGAREWKIWSIGSSTSMLSSEEPNQTLT